LLNTAQIRRDYSLRPAGLYWRSSSTFVVSTVALALFTDIFLYGLFVPILPFMLPDRVGVPQEDVQNQVSILLTAYAGASVLVSPFAGFYADRFSVRQTPFLLSLTSLFGATLLLSLGRTLAVLLVARILQGVSAAFVWAIGMALCFETVAPAALGKAIGSVRFVHETPNDMLIFLQIFSFVSFGSLLAPSLGGILYEKAGLRAVYRLAFLLLALDLVMRMLLIEPRNLKRYSPDEHEHDVDESSRQPRDQSQDREEPCSERTALLSETNEEHDEYRLPSDLPPAARLFKILPCLSSPRLIAALFMALIQGVLLGSIDTTVPIVSRDYFGFSSLQAGLMLFPIGVTNLVCGPLLGICVDRFGTRPVAVLVYAYLIPVLILLRLPQPGGADQVVMFGALLSLVGIGIAGMGAPSIVEAGMVVQRYHEANPDIFGEKGPYAQLYSLSFCFYSTGLAIGPELAALSRQLLGYGNMNALLAVICGATALVCSLILGRK